MSEKDIASMLILRDSKGDVVDTNANVSFKYAIRQRTINRWNRAATQAPYVGTQPYKNAYLLVDEDNNLGHFLWGYVGSQYPVVSLQTTLIHWGTFHQTATLGTIAAGSTPRVIGALALYTDQTNFVHQTLVGDDAMSIVDIPLDITNIGANIWYHPMTATGIALTTAVGVNYVTYSAGYWSSPIAASPASGFLVRIETGTDAGYYFCQYHDFVNSRLYLRTLDGRMFSGSAAASVTASVGPGRRAWFNEAGVIQLSTGHINTGGRYQPRQTDPQHRGSYIVRITYEKTGSTEAATSVQQQGTHSLSMVPWTHGAGGAADTWVDYGNFLGNGLTSGSTRTIPSFSFLAGGVNGGVIDQANQRFWFGYTNASNQSGIAMLRWKTQETFREIASYLGTAGQASTVTPTLTLGAGDIIQDMELGSNVGSAAGWVYTTIAHATGGNAGVAIIKPDLSTLQYKYVSGSLPTLPASYIGGCALDKSRCRVSGAASTSTNGSDQVTATDGVFTASDIGRAIKIAGLGADSGTYLIYAIGSLGADGTTTTANVTTMAGGAVTFTSQSGGTYEIGDRLYIFFSNVAATGLNTNLNKMTYMESLSPGTFLQKTSVTLAGSGSAANATYINTRVPGGTYLRYGSKEACDCDQANGMVYWLSNDGTGSGNGIGTAAANQQLNRYDPATNTNTTITVASIQSPSGGSGTITNIAVLSAVKVSSKFDAVWIGTDQGHVKLLKSTWAAADVKRYYGVDIGSYVNPTGFPRPAGSLSTGGWSNTNYVRFYIEMPDGRMIGMLLGGASGATGDHVCYSNETDTWQNKTSFSNMWYSANGNEGYSWFVDQYGTGMYLMPGSGFQASFAHSFSEVEYQWDAANSVWVPLEQIHNGLPSKGVTTETQTNGATTQYSATFTGSGFVSTDVGSWLTILTGTSKGIYRIKTYNSASSVDLAQLSGLPLKAAATASSLSYWKTGTVMGREMHSTMQPLIYGVQTQWVPQGGATPYNNEFLGRGAIDRVPTGNGVTSSGGNTFTEAGFSFPGTADVGKLLKLETGADAGIYRIATVSSANAVTLVRLDGSTPTFTNQTNVVYSQWNLGTPGSTAGPENLTFYVADGIAIDTNQDLTGMTFEHFMFKTRNYENAEGRKFCVANPLAVPGPLTTSPDTKVYWETYAVNGTRQWDPSTSHHKALPGAEATGGRPLLGGMVDDVFLGTFNHGSFQTPNTSIWYGRFASNVLGYSPMVDFGKDVEVGYVVLRTYCQYDATNQGLQYNKAASDINGLIANLYRANHSGGVPQDSISSGNTRIASGGSNLASTANTTTVTTALADGFVVTGASGATGSDGTTVTGQNIFTVSSTPFASSDVGKILKITGGDAGSYRIITLNSTSSVTISNLDQTAKTWANSAAGVGYTVYDGVREEDMIVFTAGGNQQKICVERLLTSSSFQARTPPDAAGSSLSWVCYKPTWTPVKRLSCSTEAVPPDVSNNKTWISGAGGEDGDIGSMKIFFDLTDLSSAQRTGRFWKFTALPRGNGNSNNSGHALRGIEFFDTSGKRLAQSKYNWSDQALSNADFYYSWVNRIDYLQSANDAASHLSGFNSTSASIGGANGDTITLGSGNKFIGFQIGNSKSDGAVATSPGNVLTSASSAFPLSASLGRFVRISGGTVSGGVNNGVFRVTAATATTVTLAKPGTGATPAFQTESGLTFTTHEGFNVGGTYPDKIRFLSDNRDFTIATLSDDLTTITINETLQPTRTGASWEIRRSAYDNNSASTDATRVARLLRWTATYPIQSGDVLHDSRGAIRFFAEDIGTGFQRTDGGTTSSTGTFTGSGFTPDDIGRLLYVLSGADIGIYEISAYTSSSQVTVKSHYDGTATSFTATAGTLTYQIYGDRRFTFAKYVTGLRA